MAGSGGPSPLDGRRCRCELEGIGTTERARRRRSEVVIASHA
jgi:hypothetical protein